MGTHRPRVLVLADVGSPSYHVGDEAVGQAAAATSVPLALASTIAGTRGAYGFDDGADAVMPPVPSRG